MAADRAFATLADAGFISGWHETLQRVADSDASHALIRGYAQRLLYDAKKIAFEDLARVLSLMLSPGNPPHDAARWVEGLLSGSGSVLIHDDRLRELLNGWVGSASADHFLQVLPLLRRAFAQFPAPERRQIGERLQAGATAVAIKQTHHDFDEVAAAAVLPTLRLIWNLGDGDEP